MVNSDFPDPDDEMEVEYQRQRLINYVKYYSPDKVSKVDEIIAKYRNDLQHMWTLLERKYGPESEIEAAKLRKEKMANSDFPVPEEIEVEDNRQRLIKYLDFYCPEKVSKVDEIVAKYRKDFHQMWLTLERKYGFESDIEAAKLRGEHRRRLATFFRHYAPHREENDINSEIRRYEGKFDSMWRLLEMMYGPESATPWNQNLRRLRRYCEMYSLDKNENDFHRALSKYDGNFDAMWTNLEGKYGPENPVVDMDIL